MTQEKVHGQEMIRSRKNNSKSKKRSERRRRRETEREDRNGIQRRK